MFYKWYALGLLFMVGIINYIDRLSVYVLQIQIKQELLLSDTQLGAITGAAFSVVYALLLVPIARLADSRSRKLIVMVSLVVWSVLTALCGLATGFLSLVLLRMGVAIGEAGSTPASHALISDYFNPHQRATALSIWSLSLPLGQMLAFAVGGWLGDLLGWRTVFLVLGLAGLCLAPVIAFTLKEPQRGATDPSTPVDRPVPVVQAVRILFSFRSFGHVLMGAALTAYVLYVVLNWSAPFYHRTHGASMRELGGYLAIMTGLGSGFGTIIGGLAADRLGRADAGWRMRVPMIGVLAFVPLLIAQCFVANLNLSLLLGLFTLLAGHAFYAPTVACVQSLAPANLRAFAASVLLISVTIVGMSLGPVVTGMISDYLVARYGMVADSLRYAIVSCGVFALWAAYHYHRAAQLLADDIDGAAGRVIADITLPPATPQMLSRGGG